MNGKLLKVCAAVTLIVGIGDVVCQGPSTNGNTSSVGTQQSKWSDWGNNVSVNVTGKINAVVNVRCGNKEKSLVFFRDNGEKTSESERTFPFQVRCIASTCKVNFKTTGNLKFEGKQWSITNDNGGVLPVYVKLKSPAGESTDLNEETYNMTPNEEVKVGDEETWEILFDVDDLSSKSPKGEFEGGLTIEVSAA